jgi:putative GTP pyrophosphokinase
MTGASRSPAQWGEAYRDQRPVYDSYASRVRSLLIELLAIEQITAVQVDARAKDVQSFIDKVGRKRGKYANPLRDVTDLAAARVIVYYASDVERVDALIEREFTVDHANSWRGAPSDDPDRFGYRSDHYVVSCSSTRADLGEWRPYQGLKVEIQVRTVLQHAWAAIDHRLNYKRASEIPTELRRQLFRISALLEVADDQFEAVRVAAQQLNTDYDERLASGELDLPIDRAAIDLYLERSPRTKWWSEAASAAGYNLEPTPWEGDLGLDDSDAAGELTQASQLVGFTQLADLDAFLEEAESWGSAALTAMRASARERREHGGDEWYVTPAFVITSLVYMHSQLSRSDLESATGGADFYLDGLLKGRQAIPPR